jgi:hypothetical protein
MRISSRPCTVHWALACLWIVAGWYGAAALPQRPDDIGRATVVQAFTERIERYVRLRARLEDPLPAFDSRRDPWSLIPHSVGCARGDSHRRAAGRVPR